MTTEEESAVAAASNLTLALRDNTVALGKVTRRYRIVLVAVIALAIVLGSVIQSRHEVRVESCRTNNELRSGLLAVADYLEEVGSSPEIDPLVEDMREAFALQGCEIPWI